MATSTVTLTFTPARQAELIALFSPSADVLAERVREVGGISAANDGMSGAKIHAALTAGLAVNPVGLSQASVENALAAHRMAHDVLSAEAAPLAYADVLTAIHAVRVKPLRAAWDALIAERALPAVGADAERAALILDAVSRAQDAAEAEKARKAAEKKNAETPAGETPADADAETPAHTAETAPAERAVDALANVRAMLADILDADALAFIAAEAAALSAEAAERAATLTAPATPARAAKAARRVKASA